MSSEEKSPEGQSPEAEKALSEFLRRREAGDDLDFETYCAERPGIAEALRILYSIHCGGETVDVRPDETMPVTPAGEAGERDASGRAGTTSPPAGTKVRYFGDYELLEEVARGGMGVVYEARQVSLNRIVALKMILSGQLASEDDVRRFRTEAEAAANLKHPNIVAIHEVGEHKGQHYFSMDYIEGESLADMVRDGPLPLKCAAELVKTLAEAVQYAHDNATLHRDLKPSNILMDASGQPHITDFGLAKKIEGESKLTASGAVLGTPSYMPPEQALGKAEEIGPASDVYALGAVLYELLTGRPPFRAETALETLKQVVDTEPAAPRLLNREVPRDLETVCIKCLEKERSRRYLSAKELAEELGRFSGGLPIKARPANWGTRFSKWVDRRPGVSLILGLSVFVGLFLLRELGLLVLIGLSPSLMGSLVVVIPYRVLGFMMTGAFWGGIAGGVLGLCIGLFNGRPRQAGAKGLLLGEIVCAVIWPFLVTYLFGIRVVPQ